MERCLPTHLWWTLCCRACLARRPWPASWAAAGKWRSAASGRDDGRPCPAALASASISPARPWWEWFHRRIPFFFDVWYCTVGTRAYLKSEMSVHVSYKIGYVYKWVQLRSVSSKRSPKLWKKSAWTVLSLAVRSLRRTAGPPGLTAYVCMVRYR